MYVENQPTSPPPCPVAADALQGIPRQQSNSSRWQGDSWFAFCDCLRQQNIEVRVEDHAIGMYQRDAGGIAYSKPHGAVLARDAQQISTIMRAAQKFSVPVTVRGGGLTTEGESIAYGGLLLDMSCMHKVLNIDTDNLTVRTQAGIYWHSLAEALRRQKMDYLSAPLNMTSSVGGTLGVGGIDVNSPQLGCSADQALSMQIVTPMGEILECSDQQNQFWFERIILGYGQFGIITEVTLRIRPYTPLSMQYFYYHDLKSAILDLQTIDQAGASDYSGILTMMDKVVTLLVAFDSEEKQQNFNHNWRNRIKGFGESRFSLNLAFYYASRPWRFKELYFLWRRKRTLFPDLHPKHHMYNGRMLDRTVVFSRAVWRHWGGNQVVIPDLATNIDKFVEAVERGNKVCQKYFPYYTLYCVGIKLRPEHRAHYELSSIPLDAEGWAYGCEFEPMLNDKVYSRDYLQSFKNDIYDIGVDMGASYYRFGGMMKSYIRRVFGDALVDKHLAMKREVDPAMILNPFVIF